MVNATKNVAHGIFSPSTGRLVLLEKAFLDNGVSKEAWDKILKLCVTSEKSNEKCSD